MKALVLHKNELARLEALGEGHRSVETSPFTSNMDLETQAASTLWGGMAAIHLDDTTPYCGFCDRVFVSKQALQSHVENSKVHKKEVKRQEKQPIKAAMLTPGTVSSTVLHGHQSHGQAINLTNHQAAVLATYQPQTLNNGIYGAYPLSRLGLPDSVTPGIHTSSTTQQTNCEMRLGFEYQDNLWSVISTSERLDLLESLKDSCHSSYDLQKNQYLLRPYGADDIAGLRKCVNCDSWF